MRSIKLFLAFNKKYYKFGHVTADIISIFHKLGLNVAAEGVENRGQREYLEKHKYDILQGYLISKPLE